MAGAANNSKPQTSVEAPMNAPFTDWRSISEAASREQDPERLISLVEELNRVLLQREVLRKQRLSTN
jgi:hypothetical protein